MTYINDPVYNWLMSYNSYITPLGLDDIYRYKFLFVRLDMRIYSYIYKYIIDKSPISQSMCLILIS